jgi:hypothetical protein
MKKFAILLTLAVTVSMAAGVAQAADNGAAAGHSSSNTFDAMKASATGVLPPRGGSNAAHGMMTSVVAPDSVIQPFYQFSNLASNAKTKLYTFELGAKSNVSVGINQWPYNGSTSGVRVEYDLADSTGTAQYWYTSDGYYVNGSDSAYWSGVPNGTWTLWAWNLGTLNASGKGNLYD